MVHVWWGGFGSNLVFSFCAFEYLKRDPYGENSCGTFGGVVLLEGVFTLLVSK